MTSVGIVDYGAGNIRSIVNAFDHIGADTRLVGDPDDLDGLSHLVLPGVGAFAFCMTRLTQSGLLPSLERWTLGERRPLLGICVGMQLLAQSSEELGHHEGLGWIGGRVQAIPPGGNHVRVPHVGWNNATFAQPFGTYSEGSSADFYFDHSFALFDAEPGEILADCTHGIQFTVAARRDNIVAAQFHPEKSQDAGLALLEGFVTMTPC